MSTEGEMEDMLQSLSGDLDDAYRDTISRIRELSTSRAKMGMQVLLWVCYAKPMQILELREALSVRHNQSTRNEKYRPTVKTILECCQGLVLVDRESSVVRFTHHTVQEYLTRNASHFFASADLEIAMCCIRYLLLDNFLSGPWKCGQDIVNALDDYSFLRYAASYWSVHSRSHQNNPELRNLLLQFLDSHPSRAHAKQISAWCAEYRWSYCSQEECLSLTPLHMASWAGLETIIPYLLDAQPYFLDDRDRHIEAETSLRTTPIMLAAGSGHAATVQALLDRGADPYASNWYGNTIQCATEAGEVGVIRLLVKNGMPAGNDPRYDRLPIASTTDRDSVDALSVLLELGANLVEFSKDKQEGDCHSDGETNFLHRAAMHGASGIVSMLLKKQLVCVDSSCRGNRTALHHAAAEGHVDTIRVLLAAGAEVNHLDDQRLTPLDYSALVINNETDIIDPEDGAPVSNMNADGFEATYCVTLKLGYLHAIELLLQRGATSSFSSVQDNPKLRLSVPPQNNTS
jgi:ankyrin repeat protein